LSLAGADAGNYVLDTSGASATANITPKTLTVGAANVANKVYDATTATTVNSVALTGIVSGDTIAASSTGTFADKNVGNAKTVTVAGIALNGADAGNFVLNATSTTGTANITPATLTVGAANVSNKIYDGNTAATVTGVNLTGVVSGDSVATSSTGAFANKNVGNGKAVAVSGIALNGTDAGNYVLSATNATGTANITPATLGVGPATIATKVYDGTTTATVSGVNLTGVIAGDSVGTASTGAFNNKNAGTGKSVAVSGIALNVSDAGNYVLSSASTSGTGASRPRRSRHRAPRSPTRFSTARPPPPCRRFTSRGA
jgi:hypothetical protein